MPSRPAAAVAGPAEVANPNASTSAAPAVAMSDRRGERKEAWRTAPSSSCRSHRPAKWPEPGLSVRVAGAGDGCADPVLVARQHRPVDAAVAVHERATGSGLVVALDDETGHAVVGAQLGARRDRHIGVQVGP